MMLRLPVLLALMVVAAMASPQPPESAFLRQILQGGGKNSGSRDFCNYACTRIYLPVCGSDGKTYPNTCVLDYYTCAFGNVTYDYSGECEEQQQCPTSCSRVKNPVCGSDGRTYGNECRLRMVSCAGTGITKVKDGSCSSRGDRQPQTPCPVVCPYQYSPVCGSDGRTYPNRCTLDAAICKDNSITLQYIGNCDDIDQGQQRCPTSCPFDYAPVCGSNGNTYANLCTFQSSACRDSSLWMVADGPCGDAAFPPLTCPPTCRGNYKPVCGSDGNTYGNQCTLTLVSCREPSITLASWGECGAPFNRCPDVCPEVQEAVCGSDGITYRNECVFKAATCRDTTNTFTITAGECVIQPESPCPVLCPARYKPVCGTDGKTYPNQCVLESEACNNPSLATASKGECLNNASQSPSDIPTRSFTTRAPPTRRPATTTTTTIPAATFTLLPPRLFCPNNCDRIFSPVCGRDGKTYYNRCLLSLMACRERRPHLVAYLGRCRDSKK